MSQTAERLVVSAQRREGLARSCDIRIGARTLVTPGFLVRIDSQEKLDLYLKLKEKHPLSHLSGYLVRLSDAQRTLARRLRESTQLDLQGRFVDRGLMRSSLSDLVLIEPALENLYYGAHLGDFALTQHLPRQLVEYALEYHAMKTQHEDDTNKSATLRKWLDENHAGFWKNLQGDERGRLRFVRDVLEREVEFGAAILVPPVPLITNSDLFELTKTINNKSLEVSRLARECAQAFTFRIDALRKPNLTNDLIDFIDESKARLTILKFKYLNLNEEDRIVERQTLRSLMQDFNLKSRIDPNRTFMLLEAGNQAFVCAGRGFDFLSTSFSLDRDDRLRRIARSPWGKWYDPRYQTLLDRESFLDACRNNGDRVPDDCPECLSTTKPETLSIEEWNRYVKRHYLHRRHMDYRQIADAISKGTATVGAIDRVRDSVLKNLVELLR